MSARRDHDRSISAWLTAQAPDRAPDEVLEASRARLRTIRQRRFWWPGWRPGRMPISAKLVAITTLLLVALTGYTLLPRIGITGAGGGPLPGASLVARGDVVIRDWGRVEFEATRDLLGVWGQMAIGDGRGPEWPLIIDLRCSRTTEDGLLAIGGLVTGVGVGEATAGLRGELAAVALKPGSPVKAAVWVGRFGSPGSYLGTEGTACPDYLDTWLTWSRTSSPGEAWLRDDIEGRVEFGP